MTPVLEALLAALRDRPVAIVASREERPGSRVQVETRPADVKRVSPQTQAALDWLGSHWNEREVRKMASRALAERMKADGIGVSHVTADKARKIYEEKQDGDS